MKTLLLICFSLCVAGTNASNNQLMLTMNGNGHSDEIAVIFNSDGSTAFNPDLDAWKLFSPVPSIGQLYTQCAPDEPLSVYAMPLSALDTTVDLYAMIGQAGSYTIT